MTKLRLGLVGHGPWGRNIERTLNTFDDVSLTLIGRTTPRPTDLDAVLVATPAPTHANIALSYVEKGIDTFIEKPMATSVGEAELVRAEALMTGALVFVGHVDLYNPAFRRALDVLPTLGAVRHIQFEGMNDRPLPHSSPLWEWLPHPLAAARTILRTAPTRAAAWNLAAGTAKARVDFGAVSVVSTVSWQSPIKKRRLTVTCEAGELVFDDTQAAKLTLHREGREPSPIEHGNELPLTLELRAFVDAVAAGRKDRSQLDDALLLTRAIAAAERSAAEGGTEVTLPT